MDFWSNQKYCSKKYMSKMYEHYEFMIMQNEIYLEYENNIKSILNESH